MPLLTKQQVILFMVLGLGIVVLLSFFFIPKKIPTNPTQTPTSLPIKMQDVPYKPSTEGSGVDTNSQVVNNSSSEIMKLYDFLPYQNEFVSSKNKKISIVIPDKNLQINPWTLTVQIFGIDYQVKEGEPDYQIAESSFLEAVNKTFIWMNSQGVDPGKIIISWGDKAYIQNQAEKWLENL